jgi:hypothetical protein
MSDVGPGRLSITSTLKPQWWHGSVCAHQRAHSCTSCSGYHLGHWNWWQSCCWWELLVLAWTQLSYEGPGWPDGPSGMSTVPLKMPPINYSHDFSDCRKVFDLKKNFKHICSWFIRSWAVAMIRICQLPNDFHVIGKSVEWLRHKPHLATATLVTTNHKNKFEKPSNGLEILRITW